MSTDWHKFALNEIKRSKKDLTKWEEKFLYGDNGMNGVANRIELDLSLTDNQENYLTSIHERLTDIR